MARQIGPMIAIFSETKPACCFFFGVFLPRPEKELLITIRTGNYGSLERLLSLANSLFKELEEAEAKSGLPEKVDRTRISALVSETYLHFWNNSLATPGCQP